MHASALNFAIGFFGYPFEGQYQQSITIESTGVRAFFRDLPSAFSLNVVQFNNSLAPYTTCVVTEDVT